MATVTNTNSKRMYSWWWDSHISPKNSKWLQENLTDMDVKVKQMIKLIEEDADSFARRAEMYYKKRPELMKLVEEFYRAYRALAERYDHATGALRQAHRTMAEAFPNQVPFVLGDESPGSFGADCDPRTPDMATIRALLDSDDLQKDAIDSVKRNGDFTQESDSVVGRKGLKQFNDLFVSGDHAKFSEGRVRKGLNFHDVEEKERGPQSNGSQDRVGKAEQEISTLKDAIAKLEAEKEAGLLQYREGLERLSNLQSEVSRAKENSEGLNERASKAEAEVQKLKEAIAKLEAERETSFVQYQQCVEKISRLEENFSHVQRDAGELNERAKKAEVEAESLKQDLEGLKVEKEAALGQYNNCLERISDLEDKLLHAEEDARRFSERAHNAESEVETLKQEVAKLTEEKEAALVQYQKCLEIISSLEHKLACVQEEAERLHSEIDVGVEKLKGAEERCLLLERSNQTMHSELESLAQKVAAQTEELTEKQQEVGRLWTCVQEERLRFVEAETAFQTLQDLHSQSQEELRSMAAQLQTRIKMLEELEACNQSLQNEVEQVKVDNKSLNEVNLSSALTIQNLQDEIAGLRDTIRKLEAEVELRVDQRNALQQEIYCLKKELNDLTKQHQEIVEQVESVGYRPDCFGSSVKDMQDENAKLKEVCERDRTEKIALKEKLETMEKLVEKNALLENSLSDLNVELDEVREKVKALEESCQSLMGEKSTLLSEKATLVSQLQIATDNLEKLVEKNNFLENSLHDVNAEVEDLRLKFKSLEDTCLSLENEKSDLATVKGSLISQLEATGGKLEALEKNYVELEKKYLSLEKERESALNKVEELQGHLDNEKHAHGRLAELNESKMAGMASQICLLKQEGQHKNKLYEEELDKGLSNEVEIFVLQKCIQDLEENNFSLLLECQKLLEASKLADKVISELEHENCKQQVEVKSLFDKIKLLRMGLYRVLAALNLDANQCCKDNADQDQTLLNHVLNKLEETQESLFMAGDEKQKLVIESSIFVTLLEQLQLEVESLMTAKGSVDEELRTRSEQLLVLRTESQKLKEMNEGLKLKIIEGDHREEVLMVELKNVHGQLLDLQGAHQKLHQENCKVLEEKTFLTQSLSDLGEERCDLEEEICAIFAETVSQGFLSLIFRDIISRKDKEIEDLTGNLDKLGYVNNDLKEKVKMMEGKLDQLPVLEDENIELHKMVCDMKCKHDEVEAIRAKQENQITKLSGDCDQQRAELQKLHGELLEHKSKEEILNQQLQNERNEVALWESQAATFLGELQISQVQEALFEGKVRELIKACETFEDAHCSKALEIDQLKERVSTLEGENGELKAQMRAYVPAFISLKDCITSLENHTISRATRQKADKKGEKDAPIDGHAENCRQMDEEGEGSALAPSGLLELEQLQTRIRTIEKALMERERLLMLENLSANSKLEAAIRQIEELKSGRKLRREAVGAAASNDLRLEKRTHEISEEPSEVMTKDIMLDQVSDCSSHGFGRREMMEADRMLEIWGTDYQEGSIDLTVGKAQKGATAPAKKKHHRDHPSAESLFEKEVAVDKLEISKNFSGSRQEGNERKILERLDSDVQKLTNLQITVQDLKRKVEISEKSKDGKGIEYDSVKEQLEESEETIMKLFDLNREILKTIEDDAVSFHEKSSSASDEKGSIRGRKIGEQARRVSEKIGRLQLEVQKLQFLLLKLDDGNKSRSTTKITERKTRVLLRDYLYGRTRTSPRRKKGHFCACVQPRTYGD